MVEVQQFVADLLVRVVAEHASAVDQFAVGQLGLSVLVLAPDLQRTASCAPFLKHPEFNRSFEQADNAGTSITAQSPLGTRLRIKDKDPSFV